MSSLNGSARGGRSHKREAASLGLLKPTIGVDLPRNYRLFRGSYYGYLCSWPPPARNSRWLARTEGVEFQGKPAARPTRPDPSQSAITLPRNGLVRWPRGRLTYLHWPRIAGGGRGTRHHLERRNSRFKEQTGTKAVLSTRVSESLKRIATFHQAPTPVSS